MYTYIYQRRRNLVRWALSAAIGDGNNFYGELYI